MLPTIVITPLQPPAVPAAADIYIFLSPDAVEYGLPFLRSHEITVNHAMILAVGQATARVLRDAGISGAETPSGNLASSEGLLAMSCLRAGQVRGRRVLLICGVGGRALLTEKLHARGARVERLEIYRRDPAESNIVDAIQTAGGGRPDVTVVTSVEGMENLARLIHAQGQEWLLAVPLVVMSKRIAAECQCCGFTGTANVAPGASDDGLIAALVEYVDAKKS